MCITLPALFLVCIISYEISLSARAAHNNTGVLDSEFWKQLRLRINISVSIRKRLERIRGIVDRDFPLDLIVLTRAPPRTLRAPPARTPPPPEEDPDDPMTLIKIGLEPNVRVERKRRDVHQVQRAE